MQNADAVQALQVVDMTAKREDYGISKGSKTVKYALVTGAFGGMGQRTVARLIKEGFCVFALDYKIGKAAPGMIPIQADVTDAESIRAAFETVKGITNALSAIVHFAGIYLLDSLVEIDDERFFNAFRVNAFGAFLINKTFLPLLHAGSRIIITTSELAPLDPLPFTGIYAVTKSTLDQYAYSLCMELQLLDIAVSVIRAGAVDTGMLGVSTRALAQFCQSTSHYCCNADRFKAIVDSVEAKCVPPGRIAEKAVQILQKKHPAFVYNVNRNPLLLLMNLLPKKMQLWAIKTLLKP